MLQINANLSPSYHAYESQSAKFMDPLTPDDIRKQDTSFKRLLFP